MKEEPEPTIIWDRFLVVFREKYIPQSVQDAKYAEFYRLKQWGQMSVTEYEVEFTRLSQYGKHLISTENLKARRFKEGLHPDIRDVILPIRLVTYTDIVDRAMIVERNVNSRKKFTEKKKRRFDNFDGKKSSDFSPKKQNAGPSNVGRQNNNRGNKVPRCNTCGSFHSGECRKAAGTCFNCGEGGHMKRIVLNWCELERIRYH
ncbi:uncharacterized protein LOC114297441 [Camellia sinensis]|uniref:uncharacterized protein LOC114297441 n=1 Tax=Camellia sinensis TaxID=4442 RepID=UPI001036BD06|nr:uncharacterized protein LOC114297441 [Camellia sinensis]